MTSGMNGVEHTTDNADHCRCQKKWLSAVTNTERGLL